VKFHAEIVHKHSQVGYIDCRRTIEVHIRETRCGSVNFIVLSQDRVRGETQESEMRNHTSGDAN
jgi:hypothetical protein